MDWLTAAIVFVIGLVVGLLITYLIYRNRRNEYESRIQQLDTSVASRNTELNNVKSQVGNLENSLKLSDTSLTDARNQVTSLQANLKGALDARSVVEANLQARNNEVAALKTQVMSLQEEIDRVKTEASAELASMQANFEKGKTAELAAITAAAATAEQSLKSREGALDDLKAQLESTTAELNALKPAKVELEANLDAHKSMLTDANTQIESLKSEVAGLAATKTDLENRLQHARAVTAEELAVMTAAMVKVKDDAVNEGYLRIAALKDQLKTLEVAKVDVDARLAEREKELVDAQGRLTTVYDEFGKHKASAATETATLSAAIASAQSAIQSKDNALGEAYARIAALRGDLDALNAIKADLDSKLTEREQELGDLKATMEQMQAAAMSDGSAS